MREIKFRLWDKEECSFATIKHLGVLDDNELWYAQCIDENEKDIDPPYFLDDKDFILTSFTGLKDSKGNEIYEGDIYSYPVEFYYDNQLIKKNTKVIVRYEDGAFLVGYKLLGDALRVDVEGEIIGNFFENPELLGVEKD